MLKVGDKVRVREDLIVGSYYGGQMFCGSYMESLKGRIATIVEAYDSFYDIDIDKEGWAWTEEMFEKIEEKESNNMKELTFREVIANIKEGEVWEGREYTITLLGNRIAINYNDGDEYNGVYPLIEGTFKLKRPQYTFQEAFKAFEEGKEIESCESERGFKSKDNDSVYILMEHEICDRVYNGFRLFSHDEIKGKWYIND